MGFDSITSREGLGPSIERKESWWMTNPPEGNDSWYGDLIGLGVEWFSLENL